MISIVFNITVYCSDGCLEFCRTMRLPHVPSPGDSYDFHRNSLLYCDEDDEIDLEDMDCCDVEKVHFCGWPHVSMVDQSYPCFSKAFVEVAFRRMGWVAAEWTGFTIPKFRRIFAAR